MLNVKATLCEKSKATLLVSRGHFDLNVDFLDKLKKDKPRFVNMALEILLSAGGLYPGTVHCFSIFRKRNPKRWHRFLKFCKEDGRIKVYCKNNKMVYEVPTYYEE